MHEGVPTRPSLPLAEGDRVSPCPTSQIDLEHSAEILGQQRGDDAVRSRASALMPYLYSFGSNRACKLLSERNRDGHSLLH